MVLVKRVLSSWNPVFHFCIWKSPSLQREHPNQGDLWGRGTSMDQVQANCSIEAAKLKGITATSKKPLAKPKENQLTSINNGPGNVFLCCWPKKVLAGIFALSFCQRVIDIRNLGVLITTKTNLHCEQTGLCEGDESQLSGQRSELSAPPPRTVCVCRQQITASGPVSIYFFSANKRSVP